MRNLGIMFFVIGAILLFFGLIYSQALTEQVVEGVTGRDTSKNLWVILGGFALLILGGAIAIMDTRKS